MCVIHQVVINKWPLYSTSRFKLDHSVHCYFELVALNFIFTFHKDEIPLEFGLHLRRRLTLKLNRQHVGQRQHFLRFVVDQPFQRHDRVVDQPWKFRLDILLQWLKYGAHMLIDCFIFAFTLLIKFLKYFAYCIFSNRSRLQIQATLKYKPQFWQE